MELLSPSPDPPSKLSELILGDVDIIPVLTINDGFHVSRLIKANSVEIVPILKAQFNHSDELQQFHIVFLSGDGTYAATVRENQRKHHPEQKVSAFALNNAHVQQLLDHFMRDHNRRHAWDVFGWKKARSKSFVESMEKGEFDSKDTTPIEQEDELEESTRKKLKSQSSRSAPVSGESVNSSFQLPPALPLELRQASVHYHRNVGKGSLMAVSSSSSPNLSAVWWWFKHPSIRLMTAIAIIPLDILIYLTDPMTYSRARKIGFVYRFFNFSNHDVSVLDMVYRLLLCLFVCIFSVTLSLLVHRVLRDYFKLPLFGYMKARDVKYKRWRLSHQDGTFYLVLASFCWVLYLCIQGYFAFGVKGGGKPFDDNNNEGIRMVTLRFSMVVIVLIKDWFILLVVVDHMLQEVRQRYTVGFDAYIKSPAVEYVVGLEEWKKKERRYLDFAEVNGNAQQRLNSNGSVGSQESSRQRGHGTNSTNSFTSSLISGLTPPSGRQSKDSNVSDAEVDVLEANFSSTNPHLEPLTKREKEKLIREIINQSWLVIASKWWKKYRVWAARILLVSGWSVILFFLISYFHTILDELDNPSIPSKVGKRFFWAKDDITERQRFGAVATSALLNIVILIQDWDIADWHNVDLRIIGLNIKDITIKLPEFLDHLLKHHRMQFINYHKHSIIHNQQLLTFRGYKAHSMRNKAVENAMKKDISHQHISQHIHHSYFYVSVKWLTLLPLFLFATFDWVYWWSVLSYRPCDYLQVWDSDTRYLYSVSEELIDIGDRSTNCSSFVDHRLTNMFDNPNQNTPLKLTRIESASYHGRYVYNDKGNYAYHTEGVVRLWLLCLLPLTAWALLLWIMCSHGKRHCLNAVNIEKAAFWDREYIPDTVTHSADDVEEDKHSSDRGDDSTRSNSTGQARGSMKYGPEMNSQQISSITTLLVDDWQKADNRSLHRPVAIIEETEEETENQSVNMTSRTKVSSNLAASSSPAPSAQNEKEPVEDDRALQSTVRKVLFSPSTSGSQLSEERHMENSGDVKLFNLNPGEHGSISTDWPTESPSEKKESVTDQAEQGESSRSRSFDRLHQLKVNGVVDKTDRPTNESEATMPKSPKSKKKTLSVTTKPKSPKSVKNSPVIKRNSSGSVSRSKLSNSVIKQRNSGSGSSSTDQVINQRIRSSGSVSRSKLSNSVIKQRNSGSLVTPSTGDTSKGVLHKRLQDRSVNTDSPAASKDNVKMKKMTASTEPNTKPPAKKQDAVSAGNASGGVLLTKKVASARLGSLFASIEDEEDPAASLGAEPVSPRTASIERGTIHVLSEETPLGTSL